MNKITKNKKRMNWLASIISIILISASSCKKLVETAPPSNNISGANAYSIDATAIAVLDGIYISMNQSGAGSPIQGNNSIALFAGLSADEFTLYNGVTSLMYQGYYKNTLLQSLGSPSNAGSEHWAPLYNYIFKCNAAIEGLNASPSLTPAVKQQLLGESKFLRGFFYFYLVNLFGDVPLVLGTDPEVNTLLARSTKSKVYEQIIADLTDAELNLSDSYLNGTLLIATSDRVRPTKWSAIALLARVYLYIGDYAKSETKSTAIISNSGLFGPLPSLNNVFLKNSREAIWQIQPTAINSNTQEAQTLVLSAPANGPNTFSRPVYFSSGLLNSFESGDQRSVNGNWIKSVTVGSNTYWFPYKYKINSSPGVTSASGMSEYFMMLRLGEQYLIRAEARAKQNNLSGAIDDLDKIRGRAGLPFIATTNPGISQTALLDKILHERQVELFSEWGHRWFDLKRTGNIDAVMTIATQLKSNNTVQWQSYQQWYPLPLETIQGAPNVAQNSGY